MDFSQSYLNNQKVPIIQKKIDKNKGKNPNQIWIGKRNKKDFWNLQTFFFVLFLVIVCSCIVANYYALPRVWKVNGKIVLAIDPKTGKDISVSRLPAKYTEISVFSRNN